jgi:hypothetical protein
LGLGSLASTRLTTAAQCGRPTGDSSRGGAVAGGATSNARQMIQFGAGRLSFPDSDLGLVVRGLTGGRIAGQAVCLTRQDLGAEHGCVDPRDQRAQDKDLTQVVKAH